MKLGSVWISKFIYSILIALGFLVQVSSASAQVSTEVSEAFIKAACANDPVLMEVFSKYPGINASWISPTIKDSAFTCAAKMDNKSAFLKLLELFPTQFDPQQKGSLGQTCLQLLRYNYAAWRQVFRASYEKLDLSDSASILSPLGTALKDAIKNDPQFLKFYSTILMPIISFQNISSKDLNSNFWDASRSMGDVELNEFSKKVLAETNVSQFIIPLSALDLFFKCHENQTQDKYCDLFAKSSIPDQIIVAALDRYIVKSRDADRLRKLRSRLTQLSDAVSMQIQNLLNQTKWFDLVDIFELPSAVVEKSDAFLNELIFQKENWDKLVRDNRISQEVADIYAKALKETLSWELPINSDSCGKVDMLRAYPISESSAIIRFRCNDKTNFNYIFYFNGKLVESNKESQVISLDSSTFLFGEDPENKQGSVAFLMDSRIGKNFAMAKFSFQRKDGFMIRSKDRVIVYDKKGLSAFVYDWDKENGVGVFNSDLSALITNNMKQVFNNIGRDLLPVTNGFVADCGTKRIYSADFKSSSLFPQMDCSKEVKTSRVQSFFVAGQSLIAQISPICFYIDSQEFCSGGESFLANDTEVLLVQKSSTGMSTILQMTGEKRSLLQKYPPQGAMIQDMNMKPWQLVPSIQSINGKVVLKLGKFDLNCGRDAVTKQWVGCE